MLGCMKLVLRMLYRLLTRPFSSRSQGLNSGKLTGMYLSEVQNSRGLLSSKYRGNRERV
jgi:hypothetical protein